MKYKEVKRCNNCKYFKCEYSLVFNTNKATCNKDVAIKACVFESDCQDHKLKDGAKRLYEEVTE